MPTDEWEKERAKDKAKGVIKSTAQDGNRLDRASSSDRIPSAGEPQYSEDYRNSYYDLECRGRYAPALERLRTDNPLLRQQAKNELIQMGPRHTAIIPNVIRCLKDKRPENRVLAAQLLGQIGPDAREAIPALNAALNDKIVMVRVKVLAAIQLINS